MSNLEKYNQAFLNSLNLAQGDLRDDLNYRGVEEWDSVGHMNLVAELEEAFDIMLETEDIIDFSSYAKGKEILNKYDVTLE